MTKENSAQLTYYGHGGRLHELNNGEPRFIVKQMFIFTFI